jgi:hypothetical protein
VLRIGDPRIGSHLAVGSFGVGDQVVPDPDSRLHGSGIDQRERRHRIPDLPGQVDDPGQTSHGSCELPRPVGHMTERAVLIELRLEPCPEAAVFRSRVIGQVEDKGQWGSRFVGIRGDIQEAPNVMAVGFKNRTRYRLRSCGPGAHGASR